MIHAGPEDQRLHSSCPAENALPGLFFLISAGIKGKFLRGKEDAAQENGLFMR